MECISARLANKVSSVHNGSYFLYSLGHPATTLLSPCDSMILNDSNYMCAKSVIDKMPHHEERSPALVTYLIIVAKET